MCGGFATVIAPSLTPVVANWEPPQAIGVTKIRALDPLALEKIVMPEPRESRPVKSEGCDCPGTPSPSGRPPPPRPPSPCLLDSISSFFAEANLNEDTGANTLAQRPSERATSGRVQCFYKNLSQLPCCWSSQCLMHAVITMFVWIGSTTWLMLPSC